MFRASGLASCWLFAASCKCSSRYRYTMEQIAMIDGEMARVSLAVRMRLKNVIAILPFVGCTSKRVIDVLAFINHLTTWFEASKQSNQVNTVIGCLILPTGREPRSE